MVYRYASMIVESKIPFPWRQCFLMNTSLLFMSFITLGVNFRNRLLLMQSEKLGCSIKESCLLICKAIAASAVVVISCKAGAMVGLAKGAGAIVGALFFCIFFGPIFKLVLLSSGSRWIKLSNMWPRLAQLRHFLEHTTDPSWSSAMQKSTIATYTAISHFNSSIFMLFLRKSTEKDQCSDFLTLIAFVIHLAEAIDTKYAGVLYLVALVPIIVCRLLIRPRYSALTGLVIPCSFIILISGSILVIMTLVGDQNLSVFIVAELILGTGIGFTTLLQPSEDGWSNQPEVFEAAGIALAHIILLATVAENGTPLSAFSANSKIDAEANGWVFGVPTVATCAVFFILGLPHLVLTSFKLVRRYSRFAQRAHERRKTVLPLRRAFRESEQHNKEEEGLMAEREDSRIDPLLQGLDRTRPLMTRPKSRTALSSFLSATV